MTVTPTPLMMKPKAVSVQATRVATHLDQPTLLMVAGISGSGKSTWSRAWVEQDPENRVRVNRDDLRAMMFTVTRYADEAQESALTVAVDAVVASALKAGKSVVVDSTNTHILAAEQWKKFAVENGATFKVKPFPITFEEAKKRVAQRASEGGLFVPDEIIEKQLETFNRFYGQKQS